VRPLTLFDCDNTTSRTVSTLELVDDVELRVLIGCKEKGEPFAATRLGFSRVDAGVFKCFAIPPGAGDEAGDDGEPASSGRVNETEGRRWIYRQRRLHQS